MNAPIAALLGLTLAKIEEKEKGSRYPTEIVFTTTCGRVFKQYHDQDCCEDVYVDEIHGDLNDLIGSPIFLAETVSSKNTENEDGKAGGNAESYTWTFSILATIKGYVTIKWFGESNGYYSEDVDFIEIKERKNG